MIEVKLKLEEGATHQIFYPNKSTVVDTDVDLHIGDGEIGFINEVRPAETILVCPVARILYEGHNDDVQIVITNCDDTNRILKNGEVLGHIELRNTKGETSC